MIALKTPVRIGQTNHYFMCMQIKNDKEVDVTINLSPEEIQERFGEELVPEITGPLHDVLSRLIKTFVNVSIIKPSGFKTSKDSEALKCSNKANEGFLYPLSTAFLFVHKPVTYILHKDITHIELMRIQDHTSVARTFDISIVSKTDGSVTFSGIDKQDYPKLLEYFREKKMRVRNMEDGGAVMDLDAIINGTLNAVGRGLRAAGLDDEGDEGDYDEESDESF